MKTEIALFAMVAVVVASFTFILAKLGEPQALWFWSDILGVIKEK